MDFSSLLGGGGAAPAASSSANSGVSFGPAAQDNTPLYLIAAALGLAVVLLGVVMLTRK